MSEATENPPSTVWSGPLREPTRHSLDLPGSVIDMSIVEAAADLTRTTTIFWDKSDMQSHIKVTEGDDIPDDINSNMQPLSNVHDFLQSVSKEYAASLCESTGNESTGKISKRLVIYHLGLAKEKFQQSQKMAQLRVQAGRIFWNERWGRYGTVYDRQSDLCTALWEQIAAQSGANANVSAQRIFSAITQTATDAQIGDKDLMTYVIRSLINRGQKELR